MNYEAVNCLLTNLAPVSNVFSWAMAEYDSSSTPCKVFTCTSIQARAMCVIWLQNTHYR